MDQVRVRDSGAAHCPARPPGPALPLRPQGRDSGIQSSQTSARPMTPPRDGPGPRAAHPCSPRTLPACQAAWARPCVVLSAAQVSPKELDAMSRKRSWTTDTQASVPS